MNAIREYLFRLISGAVLSAVFLSIPLRQSVKKVLGICCGCMMILLVLSPLVRLDVRQLVADFPSLWEEFGQAQGSNANEELLQSMICEQTQTVIEQQAKSLGITAQAAVQLRYDETVGSYVPYSVKLTVSESNGTLDALRIYLKNELAIPEERQTWILK